MSPKEQIAALKKQIESLQASIPTTKIEGLTVKVGDKGNLVIYGLNAKFPVSLYVNQAMKIQKLLNSPELQDFVNANAEKLSLEKAITE